MLKSMDLENGAEFLGQSMSVALTTFYGSLIANAFFSPMANKLEIAQQNEMLIKERLLKESFR